ncbi:MAG: hypothetical protein EOP84_09160 [Verrucomicrobiaceae bacterium]|nr:MAG: hypothetical protein EOP84_09160 [Verrucomicrobiaceae bacterium]
METMDDSSRFSIAPMVADYEVAGQRVAVVLFCWQGRTHRDAGAECQDFAAIYPSLAGDDTERMTLVVADGVGTRSRSREGAEFACEAIGSILSQTASDEDRLSDRFAAGRSKFVELCASDARKSALGMEHEEDENQTISKYATTALALCLDKRGYWAASVGDGAIYGLSQDGTVAKLLTSINREGFVNEIRPLTNCQWQQGFSESGSDFTVDPDIIGFCLMTDGLSECIGNPGLYFGSVWPELRKRLKDPEALGEYAEAFCQFWEDRKFSDDDKTLLAVFLNP